MAIYHFSVKVISRAAGSSALASAAYRAASRLHDQRLDRAHDFTNKSGVVHSGILLPDGAPQALSDRERLWNAVEAVENRKDAQLAREVEFAIPREMSQADGIALARDFVQREMVSRGMIADLNVHWDIGADGLAKPHAHVMLTMREVSAAEPGGAGLPDVGPRTAPFGAKVREWNATSLVEQWREAWAEHVNERLAALDIDASVDHRSLEAQGIDLEPLSKIGPAAARMIDDGLESERLEDHREIARRNGARIIQDPRVALDAITHGQATFTRRDLAMFVHRHSDGKAQFDRAMGAVTASPDLVALGTDGRGEDRFTSGQMIETEQRLQRDMRLLAERERHRVADRDRDLIRARALARAEARGLVLSGEQKAAFAHVTDGRDLGVVVGYAGTGKSAMLGVAREAWEDAGYTVRGAALSGIAAENLEGGSGIAARTIASLEHSWAQGRERLTSRDVLVIDEAGMVGTRQMARLLSHAREAGAKVVLVGDPEQLQSIEAGAAFRSIHERHGGVEITQVRRQQEDWQRDATRHLATGRTGEALSAYEGHDMVHAAETRELARDALVARWDRDRLARPDESRLILTHTNDERHALNAIAREHMRDAGPLGEDVPVKTEVGERRFASGDRVMLLKNDRGLGVKNGMLGTVETVTPTRLTLALDAGRSVAFDLKDYAQVDHGYAATIHKSQGVTVDHVHVLATPGLDRHAAYVALSRHRLSVDLHYGRDEFDDLRKLARVLSRERAKDNALDRATAGDPGDADPVRDYAERRGIRFRAKLREVAQKVRDMFEGLDLGRADGKVAGSARSPHADSRPVARAAPEPQLPGQAPARDDYGDLQRRAVQRHARAVDDIFKMHDKGLPVLPHQNTALHKARAGLNAFDPHASRDVERAYTADHGLAHEAAGGQTQRAIRAMQLEAEIRSDPVKRADRFVRDWRKLDGQRLDASSAGDMAGMRRIRDDMGAMAKSLERDPQLESLLAIRKQQLGIGVEVEMGRKLSHDLAASIGIDLGRGRGIGIGM